MLKRIATFPTLTALLRMSQTNLLAIASKTLYHACMRFENPFSSLTDLSAALPSVLPADLSEKFTDAGHTAVGFVAMAAKQANDSRLDFNARFEPQVRDFRKSAINAVKAVTTARGRVVSSVDPVVDRLVERLPDTVSETIADTVAEVRKVTRQAADTVEGRVIDAIEFATAIPAKAVRRTPAAAAKPAAAKSVPAKASMAKKPVSKKTVAEKTVAKPVAKKTAAAQKPVAKRVVTKKVATKKVVTKKVVARAKRAA